MDSRLNSGCMGHWASEAQLDSALEYQPKDGGSSPSRSVKWLCEWCICYYWFSLQWKANTSIVIPRSDRKLLVHREKDTARNIYFCEPDNWKTKIECKGITDTRPRITRIRIKSVAGCFTPPRFSLFRYPPCVHYMCITPEVASSLSDYCLVFTLPLIVFVCKMCVKTWTVWDRLRSAPWGFTARHLVQLK